MEDANPSMRDRALALRAEYDEYAKNAPYAAESFEVWLVIKVLQLRDVLWLNNISEEEYNDE